MTTDGITDLGVIRAFVAVAEAGGFVGATKATGLTRSALGKAVARLEAHLGTRLLQRTTRHVALTQEGEVFHERCVQILADLQEAEASVRQDKPEPRGTLRLTLPDAFGRLRVLPILQEYMAAWPALNLEVSFTDRSVDLIDEGYDLAIRIGGMPSDSRLVVRVVARSTAILSAAPCYLELRGKPETHFDFVRHDQLMFGGRAQSTHWKLKGPTGGDVTIANQSRFRFDSGEAIRDAAVSGIGIAYLPEFLVEADIAAGRLVPLLPNYGTEKIAIHAIYASRRHLSAKIRVLIDLLVKRLAQRA